MTNAHTTETGVAAIAVLIAIGVWVARHTRAEAHTPRRRLVLRAFFATVIALGFTTIALSEQGKLGFLFVAPTLTWLLCTFLIPFWTDNPDVVETREPERGWKTLFGMRMLYADRKNPVIWVRMRNPIPISNDMGYTPNLGNFWGRLVIAMLFVVLIASMAVAFAAPAQ